MNYCDHVVMDKSDTCHDSDEDDTNENNNNANSIPTVFLVINDNAKSDVYYQLYFPLLPVKYFSILQILLGCIAIISQIIIFVIYCQRNSIHNDYTTGEGIYSGIFYAMAGVFGLVSLRKTTTFRILIFMIFSISAFILGASHLLFSLTHMITNVRDYKLFSNVEFAMYMTMIYCSALEGLVALTSIAICCRASCCSQGGVASSVVFFPEDSGRYRVLPLPKSFAEHIEKRHVRLSDDSEELVKLTSTLGLANGIADFNANDILSDALSSVSDDIDYAEYGKF